MLIPAELRVCVTWFTYFSDPFQVKYDCAKFYHCRIYLTDFREEGFLDPHPWAAPKMFILTTVKGLLMSKFALPDITFNINFLSHFLPKHWFITLSMLSNIFRQYNKCKTIVTIFNSTATKDEELIQSQINAYYKLRIKFKSLSHN